MCPSQTNLFDPPIESSTPGYPISGQHRLDQDQRSMLSAVVPSYGVRVFHPTFEERSNTSVGPTDQGWGLVQPLRLGEPFPPRNNTTEGLHIHIPKAVSAIHLPTPDVSPASPAKFDAPSAGLEDPTVESAAATESTAISRDQIATPLQPREILPQPIKRNQSLPNPRYTGSLSSLLHQMQPQASVPRPVLQQPQPIVGPTSKTWILPDSLRKRASVANANSNRKKRCIVKRNELEWIPHQPPR